MLETIYYTIGLLIPIVLIHILLNKGLRKFFQSNRNIIASLLEEEGQIVTEELIDFSIEEMVDRVCTWYLLLVCLIIVVATFL